jgi:hypothetical protein
MKRSLAVLAAAAAAIALVPASAGAQDAATITLLHGIPGATVDVAVAGEVVIPGFEPGDTQDLSSFAGQTLTDLEVRAAGTTDVVIGPVASFDVPASGNVTVVAHLTEDGTPTLTPFVNDTSATADGSGRLTVRHTAAAPAVDIVLGDQRPFTNLSNPNEASAELPAGQIAGAQIAPTGGDPIADVPTVELEAGTNLIVYAVGSLADETFTFLTQTIEVGAGSGATAAAPTAVNTGDEAGGSDAALYAAAAALVAVAAGALVLRRRAA